MIPQTAISLVILLLKIVQLVVPFQMLVVFRQGLVRFLEESFVLGANCSLNVCVHCCLPCWRKSRFVATRVTCLIERSWRGKVNGSSTRSLLTSFHVSRIIYRDI